METVLMYLLFAVGLVLIVKGGDWFVSKALWVAEVTKIPKFVVGATILSVATALPEIIVSVLAALEGYGILTSGVENAVALAQVEAGMATGNGIGSVICNTALVMGVVLIFKPTEIDRRRFVKEIMMLGLALVALQVLIRYGVLTSRSSLVLLAVLVVYVIVNVKNSRMDFMDAYEDEPPETDKKTVIKNVLMILLSAVFIVVGSQLLVNNGSKIAEAWGISGTVAGVTMLALGTALPELVTSITALVKKQTAMSVGNIIGANVIDITLIFPLCAFFYGGTLPLPAETVYLDVPVAILVSLIAFVPSLIAKKFYRWQGILLVAVYAVYIVLICTSLDKYLALFN